jgi:hypothetical protein
VSHLWVPLLRVCGTFVFKHFFQAHYFYIISFFHNFSERLKATTLAWCLENGNFTHKHLVEMRRIARDEAHFLSAIQLRDIKLD